ncbi:MAG: DNA polymerase III subunit beta [Acidobacteriota bacterium]
MDFVTSRDHLFRELQAMQGIVERRSTIPILSNILIDAAGGRAELMATDMEVGIRSRCEAEVSEPGSLTLSARRLFDIVRHLPDAAVRLRSEENNWVVITCRRARFRIVGLARDDFPEIPEFDFREALPIEAALLLDMIAKVIFAVAADDSRPQISGVLVVVEKRHLMLVGTDGHRLARVSGRLEKSALEGRMEMVVPRKALHELSRIAEGRDEVLLGRKQNHVFFKVGGTVLSSTLAVAKFPEYEDVVPRGNDRRLRVEAGALAEVVRRVALLASDRSRAVRLSLGKGALEIASSNPEVGEAAETLEVDYDAAPMEVAFNAKYLTDFLQAVGTGTVELALKDEGTQGLLRPLAVEGRDYQYVVMPMRL